MIATLWPYYNEAVADIVHETVTPILEETCRKVRGRRGILDGESQWRYMSR